MIRRKMLYHPSDHCSTTYLLFRKNGLSPLTAYFLCVKTNQQIVSRSLSITSDAYDFLKELPLFADELSSHHGTGDFIQSSVVSVSDDASSASSL